MTELSASVGRGQQKTARKGGVQSGTQAFLTLCSLFVLDIGASPIQGFAPMSDNEIDNQASYIAENFGLSLEKAREITKAVAVKKARKKR